MATMRASDYVITPQDVWRGIRGLGLVRAVLLVLVNVGSVLALRTGLGAELVLLVYCISVALLLRIDSRVPFVAAIALLIAIAGLSAFDPSVSGAKNTLQERLAVLVYYCLVMGVALLIQEQAATAKAPVPVYQAVPADPALQHIAPTVVAQHQTVARAPQINAPAAQQLHGTLAPPMVRTTAVAPILSSTAKPILAPLTIRPRTTVDGFLPATSPRIGTVTVVPPVAHAVRTPSTADNTSGRAMQQVIGGQQIRRATRLSIDGFVMRPSPAARAQSARQFVGA